MSPTLLFPRPDNQNGASSTSHAIIAMAYAKLDVPEEVAEEVSVWVAADLVEDPPVTQIAVGQHPSDRLQVFDAEHARAKHDQYWPAIKVVIVTT